MTEKITKYISVCSILILIAAVWHQYLFYSSIGIDIFSYITLSEAITLFISTIPILLLILVIIIFYIIITISIFNRWINKISNIKQYDQSEQRRINNKNARISYLVGLFCFIFYFGPLMMPISDGGRRFIVSENYFFLRVIIAFIFFTYSLLPFLGARFDLKKINIYAITIVLIFFSSVYYSVSHKLWAVKNKPQYYFTPTNILFKDSTGITTNDSLILVGKTNSYFFLYKFEHIPELSYTKVIPTDQIKTVTVNKYGSWFRLP